MKEFKNIVNFFEHSDGSYSLMPSEYFDTSFAFYHMISAHTDLMSSKPLLSQNHVRKFNVMDDHEIKPEKRQIPKFVTEARK